MKGPGNIKGSAPPRRKAPCSQISVCPFGSVLSPMIGVDGLFSFNSKLAALVSEPDVQIKKVRHAHLILVNLPLHISPACQLLCDSNHHRHMPLLCAPLRAPSTHPPRPALHIGVVGFLPALTLMCLLALIVKSEIESSLKEKKSRL